MKKVGNGPRVHHRLNKLAPMDASWSVEGACKFERGYHFSLHWHPIPSVMEPLIENGHIRIQLKEDHSSMKDHFFLCWNSHRQGCATLAHHRGNRRM